MIDVICVSKSFEKKIAVKEVSLKIKENRVFGLVGSNGAGKSTLMRMIAGVLLPDKGEIRIDGQNNFDNIFIKKEICFLPDEQYYFLNATPIDMMKYYAIVYEKFDTERFLTLLEKFSIDYKGKIATFSKGMRKQVFILIGLCANTKYLLCDETFDGLDPVMRQTVKSIFAGELEEREFTPVIASHNLRELEDICDYVGLLHKGGVLLDEDLEEMKTTIHKVQCVFANEKVENEILQQLNILCKEKRGSLSLLTVKGKRGEIQSIIDSANPIFAEILPLSMEEIFITEMETVGYDVKKLIM